MKNSAITLALVGAAAAQTSSVISVFFPDTDPGQTLLGSLVASDATATTVAFGCAPGVDSSDCGFGPDTVTLTVGASTFRATETLDSFSLLVDCSLTGSTAAVCVQTYMGPVGDFDIATNTDDDQTATAVDTSFDTQITTTATTTTLSHSDIQFIAITLTAFGNGTHTNGATESTTTASTGASGTLSTATSTGKGSTASSGTTASGTASHTGSASPSTHTGAAAVIAGFPSTLIAGCAGLIGSFMLL